MTRRKSLLPHILMASFSLTLLTACPPKTAIQSNPAAAVAVPTATPTAVPAESPLASVSELDKETGETSENPASPTPTATPPTSGESGMVSTPGDLPEGVAALVLGLSNRFLQNKGDTSQLLVRALDAEGNQLDVENLPLEFRVNRPNDFTIDSTGLLTALTENGFTDIFVQLIGTDISGQILISVNGATFTGGGGSFQPAPTPTPPTQLAATVDFNGLGNGEFKINTYTTDNQSNPGVAMDAAGNFVVVWQDEGGQDGDGGGIFGQRYAADGEPQGAEFQINTYTTGSQDFPEIAMDDVGNFAVVWLSPDQDGDGNGIFGQRFDNRGNPVGDEFPVNTYTTGNQTVPDIAMDGDGDFVVVWSGQGNGDSAGIYGQRFDNTGIAVDSAFQVNNYTAGSQIQQKVAMDDLGNFVVVWRGPGSGDSAGIFGQRYNASGVAQETTEFLINSYTGGTQSSPKIAMDSDGDFVVAWGSSGQDGSSQGAYAQRFNSSGGFQGDEFPVNTYTIGAQFASGVAMDDAGNFTITWNSYLQDGDYYGAFAQRYSATGTPLGAEFQVNTYTTSEQFDSVIAMDADGDMVIVWESNYQDGDYYGVFGKRFNSDGEAQ